MAASLGEIAQVQEQLGKPRAVKSYNEALGCSARSATSLAPRTTLINLGALLNESPGGPTRRCRCSRERCSIAARSRRPGRRRRLR